MALFDPLLWSVLPFGDQTAWIDFLGAHALFHRQLDDVIRRQFLADPWPQLPLGDGGGDEWAEAHQLTHDGEAKGLSIALGPDLRSYDLTRADQFASWCFVHANDCQRLRQAAGA